MSNVFVEVDEAMKQERLETLWKRYGGFFIGFLVILVLGTAANSVYNSWNTAKNIKQTDLLLLNAASDDISISNDLSGGIKDINDLTIAGDLATQGETEKSLNHYNDITSNGSNIEIKQIASYMSINLSKNLSVEDKIAKLESISSDNNNPLRYHAALDMALIEASMNHDYSKSRSHISMILNSSDAPKTLRQKSQSLDILYALKEKTEPKTSQSTTP